jgi:hypothetical protein
VNVKQSKWIVINVYYYLSAKRVVKKVFDGYCRWKLPSGNLYTFIRPNHAGTEVKNAL